MHILWKIGIGFFVVIVVVFGLAFWSFQGSTDYTHYFFNLTFEDISNFDKEEIMNKIRENLSKEPTLQNRKFDYLESTQFLNHSDYENMVLMKFPTNIEISLEELQVIEKTLGEIESITELTGPHVGKAHNIII